MKTILIILGTVLTLNIVAQTPTWEWAKSAGGSDDDHGSSVAVDASGNTYVAGCFSSSTITYGTTTLTSAGLADIYLVKFDPNGNAIWAKSAGGLGNDYANSVAVDTLGNIYIAGYYYSPSVTFGVNILTNANADSADLFLAKYDTSGNLIFVKSVGGGHDDIVNSVAVDNYGNAYIAGYFDNYQMVLGSYTLLNPNPLKKEIFLAKYDFNGNVLWAKSIGGTNDDLASSIAIDNSGNVHLTGQFSSHTIIFGSTTLTNMYAGNSADFFLAKYDTNGNVLWAKSAGGAPYDDESYSVAVDDSGNSFITGYFYSPTIHFDTISITSFGHYDIFLAKYDSTGDLLWAKGIGSDSPDYVSSIATDPFGNIFMTGKFVGEIMHFGSIIISSDYSWNLFVAKFSANGNTLWAKPIPAPGAEVNSIAVDDLENFYLTGYFWTTLHFGNTALTQVGDEDMYLAKNSIQLNIDAGIDHTITCGEIAQLDSVTTDYSGSGTITYNWSPSLGLNDTTLINPTATVNGNNQYFVTVTTSDGWSDFDSVDVFVTPLPNIGICYVEFDTITSKNNIKWTSDPSVDSVYIYNEVSTNVWDLIGSVPSSQNNFIDTNSNPNNQSYSYKISILDKCSNESALSSDHKTITLLSMYDVGTNTYGFAWSAYGGLPISNYYLYGITSAGAEYLIASVPGNTYFYNYTNPYSGFVRFFIGFNTPDCLSKANHLVRSNYVHSSTGIEENTGINNLVAVYPNPVNNNLQIQTSLLVFKAEIKDLTGRILFTVDSKTIDCSSLSKGVYFLKVYTGKGITIKRFVKE